MEKFITRPNCAFCALYVDSATRMLLLFFFGSLLSFNRSDTILTCLKTCIWNPGTYRHKIVRLSSAQFGLVMFDQKIAVYRAFSHQNKSRVCEPKWMSQKIQKWDVFDRQGVGVESLRGGGELLALLAFQQFSIPSPFSDLSAKPKALKTFSNSVVWAFRKNGLNKLNDFFDVFFWLKPLI